MILIISTLKSNKLIFFINFSLISSVVGVLSILLFAGIGFQHLLGTSTHTNGDYNKAVILNFDDNRLSQYTNAKPILDKYGFKATFYVVCDYIGKKVGYMKWNQVQRLHKEGHDIASHTMNHLHLDKLSKKDIEYQVGWSKRCLQNHGINPTSFAYPFNAGSDNRTVIDAVAKYYELARTGNDALANLRCNSIELQPTQTDCRTYTVKDEPTYSNRYAIRAWSHDFAKAKNSYSDNEMLDEFIRVVNSQTKYNNAGSIDAIPIIIYHHVGGIGGFYNTDLKLFDAEMKYLDDNGFRVLTMADLAYNDSSNYLYVKELEKKPVQQTPPIIEVKKPISNATNIIEVKKPISNASNINDLQNLKQVSAYRTIDTPVDDMIMGAFYYLFGWKKSILP